MRILQLLEMAFSEGICSDESIGASMPPSFVTGIAGMIEDRDPDLFVFDQAVGIAPCGLFAPCSSDLNNLVPVRI